MLKTPNICYNFTVGEHFWPQQTIFPSPPSSDSVPDASPPSDSIPDSDRKSSPKASPLPKILWKNPACHIRYGLCNHMWQIWSQGRIQVWADSAPAPPPFWQLNHANSAYFGAKSANFPLILTLGPLFLQILGPALWSFGAFGGLFYWCEQSYNNWTINDGDSQLQWPMRDMQTNNKEHIFAIQLIIENSNKGVLHP